MQLHDFLFSYKPKYRLARHISFWFGWLLFSASVQLSGLPKLPVTIGNLVCLQVNRALIRFPPHLVFCYVTVYFLVPRLLLHRKYLMFTVTIIPFVFLLYWFTYLLMPLFDINNARFGGIALSPFVKLFYGFYSNVNFTGPIPACCVMLAIKYYKDWYIKQRESEMLLFENKQAELQLLKAQVHPHFLFNTLNNIYSFSLKNSLVAADLLDRLYFMMEYMRTEGSKSLVPVEKEIQLIQDYVGLEKVRYGERLDIQMHINGDYKNRFIAPLLMIPFVENCFKHGASVMLGKQWMHLIININENDLEFNSSNSKPAQPNVNKNKNGIGLGNVQKRLELLYLNKHQLNINSTDSTFSVYLKIELLKQPPPIITEKISNIPAEAFLKPDIHY